MYKAILIFCILGISLANLSVYEPEELKTKFAKSLN